MARYIDADSLKKDLNENYVFYGFRELLDDFHNAIDKQPTADVVPKERYDRLLESAIILSEAVSEYQEKIEIREERVVEHRNDIAFDWVSYCGGICLLKIDNRIKVIEYDTDCRFPTPLANGKLIADVELKGTKDGRV